MENWIFLCCTAMADPRDDLYLYFYCKCLVLITNYIGLLNLISIFLLFFSSLIHYSLKKLTKITNISYIHNIYSFYTFNKKLITTLGSFFYYLWQLISFRQHNSHFKNLLLRNCCYSGISDITILCFILLLHRWDANENWTELK